MILVAALYQTLFRGWSPALASNRGSFPYIRQQALRTVIRYETLWASLNVNRLAGE